MRVILGNGHLEFIRRLAGVIDRDLRRPLNAVPCRNETYRFQKKRRALRTTLRSVIAPMLDHPHRTLSDLRNRRQNFEFLEREDLVVAQGKTAKNRIRRSFDVPYPRYPPAEVRCDAGVATILIFEGLLSDGGALLFDHKQRRTGVSHELSIDKSELVDLEAGHRSARMLIGVMDLLRVNREAVGPESSAKSILQQIGREIPRRRRRSFE